MTTYIVLLRGINVSGQKKIKMVELATMFQNMGFSNVKTYIQSGNISVHYKEENSGVLEDMIGKGINDRFGYDVPVLVFSISHFKEIISLNSFNSAEDIENNRVYFVLLKQIPQQELIDGLHVEDFPNEKFIVSKKCVYLSCSKGYGKAKLNNNVLERKLKVAATTRNYKTMQKLLAIATG